MKLLFDKELQTGHFKTYSDRPDFKLISLNQTHSDNILTYPHDDLSKEADGIIFNLDESIVFAIKTADCLPIVLIGKKQGAFIHAGWRGVYNQICFNQKIKNIEPFYAFIGPSIQKDFFQVSADFRENFPDSQNFHENGGNLFFDLQKEISMQLQETYNGIQIENCAECTMQSKKYNSFRRDKTTKRNWNIFSI